MSRALRVLHVDAGQGASGDMILGGLVDLGVPLSRLRRTLRSLPLPGWTLRSRSLERCGLTACKVDVGTRGGDRARGFSAIRRILASGDLAPRVRQRALLIFRRLIEAEAEVHRVPFARVHLHEAGALDAIIDVVGACVGLEELDVGRIVVSPLTTGFGEVRCDHGVYPVPAPATALLVRGVPVRGGDLEFERLTPTGAAILTSVADAWGGLPPMVPLRVGHGAGTREPEGSPNVLRMILGEAVRAATEGLGAPRGQVAVLECTLDDSTPQALAFAAERLFASGALEVYTTPLTMKKGRPGHLLTALARPDRLAELTRALLLETSTLGLRFRLEERIELDRAQRSVKTAFGRVGVKVAELDGRPLRAWPEYDDCARLAERHAVSLWEVQRAALEAYAARRRRR